MPLQIFCIEKSPPFAIYWALTPIGTRDYGIQHWCWVVTLRASPLGLAIMPYSQSQIFHLQFSLNGNCTIGIKGWALRIVLLPTLEESYSLPPSHDRSMLSSVSYLYTINFWRKGFGTLCCCHIMHGLFRDVAEV
jgi:hypothetical protein